MSAHKINARTRGNESEIATLLKTKEKEASLHIQNSLLLKTAGDATMDFSRCQIFPEVILRDNSAQFLLV